MRVSDISNGVRALRDLARLERHYMNGYTDLKAGRMARIRPDDATDDDWLAYRAGRQDAYAGRKARLSGYLKGER